MWNGGKIWYHCLDNENGIRSWDIIVMLLYEVFDMKWLWGKAFSQARDIDSGIFEDKNPDIQKNGISQGKGKRQDIRHTTGLQISSCIIAVFMAKKNGRYIVRHAAVYSARRWPSSFSFPPIPPPRRSNGVVVWIIFEDSVTHNRILIYKSVAGIVVR